MRPVSRLFVIAGLVGTVAVPAAAQTPAPGPSAKPLFTWGDAALFGGLTIATIAVAPLDRDIADALLDSTVQANRFFGRVAAFVRTVADPGSVIIGVSLYTYGRLAKDDRAADLGLHGTEALAIGTLTGTVLKGIFGRERPYVKRDPSSYKFARGFGQDRFRSFPSGHTIAAFAAAAAVTSETRGWWKGSDWVIGPLLYGGAALTGASRMYNNRHWASDVVMGAAIGTMAGLKVVRYSHAHPDNAVDRWLLGGSASRNEAGRVVLRWSVLPVVGQ